MIIEKNIWLKILASWSMLVCVFSVILSYSRGGLLALIASSLIILLHQRPRITQVLFALIMVIVIFVNIPGLYSERMKTLVDLVTGAVDPRQEVSVSVRTNAVIVGLRMFSDYPIFGVGMRNFPAHYLDYSRQIGLDPTGTEWSPHNLYIEVLCETGIMGFLAFISILAFSFIRTIKAWIVFRREKLTSYASLTVGFGAGLVGYLMAGIFLQNSYPRYFWALVGIALALDQISKNIEEETGISSQNE